MVDMIHTGEQGGLPLWESKKEVIKRRVLKTLGGVVVVGAVGGSIWAYLRQK